MRTTDGLDETIAAIRRGIARTSDHDKRLMREAEARTWAAEGRSPPGCCETETSRLNEVFDFNLCEACLARFADSPRGRAAAMDAQ